MRIIFFLSLFLALTSKAQRWPAANAVPSTLSTGKLTRSNLALSKAKKEFVRDFGRIAVSKWYKRDGFLIARFQCTSGTLDAYYTNSGILAGLSRRIHPLELSREVQAFIAKKYKGYTAVKVVRFTAQKNYGENVQLFGGHFSGMNASFVELARNDTKLVLMIDENGNIRFFKEL